nr:MAG TPA: hypothetical protein [Caudoviricetes sp.]
MIATSRHLTKQLSTAFSLQLNQIFCPASIL